MDPTGLVNLVIVTALLGGGIAQAPPRRAKDFLGDAREELIVGAPGSARSGVAYLFRGGAAGVVATAVLDQSSLGAHDCDDEFGSAFATGDFDGDGLMDLAIGAPGDASSGSVHIWWGTGAGLTAAVVLDQSRFGAGQPGDRYGAALVSGDFDGDGFDDLAVGAAHASSGAGAVFLWRGGWSGLVPWHHVGQSGLGVDEPGDSFGEALASGDFDGDGFDDLAIGAPGEAPDAASRSGLVFIFRGGPRGLSPDRALDQQGLSANEVDDAFGSALASGDFNGDGCDDLAVGAPHEAPGSAPRSGAVFVFGGGPRGLEPWQFLVQDGLGANEAGDDFGRALASGDYDGDGGDDLAIGAPGEAPGPDPRSGAVFVFRGTHSKLEPLQVLTQDDLALNDDGDRFGAALASGNYVANGREDLAVGAPGEAPGPDPRSGAVYLFRGTASGLVPQQFLDQRKLGVNEAGDRFGAALE